MSELETALFVRDGEVWHPQEAAIGPWSPETLHGGPVAALVVSLAEELLPGETLVTTRLSLDLVRPAPLRPLVAQARVAKAGRRVSLVDVEVRDEDRVVAMARVQRTLRAPVTLPDLENTGAQTGPPPDRPGDFVPLDISRSGRRPAPFFRLATEMRTPTPGGIFEPRATAAWLRIFANLLPGVPLSPAAAICAAADYTNALGAPDVPSRSKLWFANADLSVHLARVPHSKWLRMEPQTVWLAEGLGHTRCELWDERGMLGTSAVTLPLADRT